MCALWLINQLWFIVQVNSWKNRESLNYYIKSIEQSPQVSIVRLVIFLVLYQNPVWFIILWIERFSFECRKVIGFAFATLHDWLKKFATMFHPIRSKTKTNRDSLARFFTRFASATCNYFEFWLGHCIVCVLCDWLEKLLWFCFFDTQLKTTLNRRKLWYIALITAQHCSQYHLKWTCVLFCNCYPQ